MYPHDQSPQPNNITNINVAKRQAEGMGCDPKEKPTVELLYARRMLANQNVTIEGESENGEISFEMYRWNGNQWGHTQPGGANSEAYVWLGGVTPGKATPEKAKSCVTAAGYYIQQLDGHRSVAAMEHRRGKRVVVPTQGQYLNIEKDGTIHVIPPDRSLGLTYAVATQVDPIQIHEGIYTPRPVPADSMWGDWLAKFMPDPDVANLLQEAAAASVIPTCFEKAFLLLGDGSNGKSTFLTALRAIHGQSATSISMAHINDRFGLQNIIGKTLITVAESPNFVGDNAEQTLKALISRDAVLIDRKNLEPITYTPRATIYVALNQPLRRTDQTYGSTRKYIYVPFPVKMPENKKNNSYGETMVANPTELRVFLDWLLAGAIRLIQRGRFPDRPAAVERIEEEVRQEVDNVHGWVVDSDVSLTSPIGDTGLWCTRNEVYGVYQKSTIASNQKAVSQKEFWRRMRHEFPRLQENRIRESDGRREYKASVYVPGITTNATDAQKEAARTQPVDPAQKVAFIDEVKEMFEKGDFTVESRDAWNARAK